MACFNRADAQNNRLALIPAGGKLGATSTAMAALRFRFAPPTPSHGTGGNNALTINADHSVGAGQAQLQAQRISDNGGVVGERLATLAVDVTQSSRS